MTIPSGAPRKFVLYQSHNPGHRSRNLFPTIKCSTASWFVRQR
jgi:hypothetical protein